MGLAQCSHGARMGSAWGADGAVWARIGPAWGRSLHEWESADWVPDQSPAARPRAGPAGRSRQLAGSRKRRRFALPAATRDRATLKRAASKYRKLNALALALVKPGGVLVTCSCRCGRRSPSSQSAPPPVGARRRRAGVLGAGRAA